MRTTKKQRELMRIVMKGDVDENGAIENWCDVAQIKERLSYSVSREAILCSLKILEGKQLLESKSRAKLRDGKSRTIYIPTNLAYDELHDPEENEQEGSLSDLLSETLEPELFLR